MIKLQSLFVALCFILVSSANASQTYSVTPCSSDKNGKIDFSDAPASYGVACNQTPYWQKLGSTWDADNIDQAVGADDATDDGVTWSIWSEDTQSWGEYSNDNVITEGDQVQFRYEFNRISGGSHYYDNLKVWFDTDLSNAGPYDNSAFDDGGDVITDVKWYKEQDSLEIGAYEDQSHSTSTNGLTNKYNSSVTSLVHYEVVSIPMNLDIPLGQETAETWLRARVVCSNSLYFYSDNMTMDATGYQDQGEVEDYKIVIARRSTIPSEVPAPASLAIFAMSLLVISRKKATK